MGVEQIPCGGECRGVHPKVLPLSSTILIWWREEKDRIVSNYHHHAAVKTIAFDTSRTVGFATRAREAPHPRVRALLSITQSLLSSFGVEQIHSSPMETN